MVHTILKEQTTNLAVYDRGHQWFIRYLKDKRHVHLNQVVVSTRNQPTVLWNTANLGGEMITASHCGRPNPERIDLSSISVHYCQPSFIYSWLINVEHLSPIHYQSLSTMIPDYVFLVTSWLLRIYHQFLNHCEHLSNIYHPSFNQ